MNNKNTKHIQFTILAVIALIIVILGLIVFGVLYNNMRLDKLETLVIETTATKTYTSFEINYTPVPIYDTQKNRYNRILFKSTWENEIYLILADGSSLTQVTNDGKTKSCPEWHPDGNRFVYAIPDPNRPDYFIAVEQDLSDGQTKELFTGRVSENSRTLKYSPDGAMLAYIANDEEGVSRVYVYDGAESKQITLNVGPERTVSWAPDGKVVAYQFYSNGKWFYSASTIDAVQHWMLSLTPTWEDAKSPATWPTSDLPNGRRYIVFTDINGLVLNEINEFNFSMAADASPLMSDYDDFHYGYPVYAPEGNYVAYTHGKPDACKDVTAVYMGPGEIFKRLSNTLCVDEGFLMSWSPDGQHIVIASDVLQQNWNLYVLSLDERDSVQITNSDRRDECPTWAPK
jgi:WD40 repeat protein